MSPVVLLIGLAGPVHAAPDEAPETPETEAPAGSEPQATPTGAATAVKVDALPSRPDTPPAERVEVPANVQSTREMLQSWHAEDLPAKDAVEKAGGADALKWLALNDSLLIIRERAVLLLGRHYNADSADVCSKLLQDRQSKLRAAALTCMDRGKEPDVVRRLALTAALSDPDDRVAIAAADVLIRYPNTRIMARLAAENGKTSEAVKKHILTAVKKAKD